MKISDLDLKLLVSDSIWIDCLTGAPRAGAILLYEREGKVVDLRWEELYRDPDSERPAYAFYATPLSSAPFVTYLPSGWDGSPFRAKESCEYREKWDDDMTAEEWEAEKEYIMESGEADLVPDPDGDWTVRLGTPEELEKFVEKINAPIQRPEVET